ncbi:MAG: hypothetical protein R3F44_19865 [Candidatus Competibacteraceae bacterium]|nr:hypothetical protein [Gammaproteobacteria bacterium]HRW66047.1 hypothetical protein [Candidatus Competibacter sp.]
MSENPTHYCNGLANATESLTTTDKLVALAHAHRQGVSYETGEQLLARLPERLHALTDQVLGDRMSTDELAYALAVLIDSLEHAPGAAGSRRH